MAEKKNDVDLLQGPVELARQLSQLQNASFRGQFMPAPVDFVKEWLNANGIDRKTLR